MRDAVTTVLELVGAALVVLGLLLWFGAGPACVAAGIALCGLGFVLSIAPRRRGGGGS